MGTHSFTPPSTSNTLFQNFREQHWQQIQKDNQSDLDSDPFGDFIPLQNTITKEEIDLYYLYFRNKQELSVYIECFMQRTREDYLVNAIYLEPNQSNEFCSSIYSAKCYIQHMPIRLSGITDIPFLDTLYMLWCALHGFQKLFHTVGYFSVHEDHICIDKEGLVRVWMNSDLSKNYPEGYEDLGISVQKENTMVEEIIETIFANSEEIDKQQNSNLICFKTYLQRKTQKTPTFKEALRLLFHYLRDYRLTLPTYCQSIIEIFNDQGEDYFLPNNDSRIQRMLDNTKPQFSRTLERIDQYKLSDLSQSEHNSHLIPVDQSVRQNQIPQNSQFRQSSSNHSQFFQNSFKEDSHQNLVIVKKKVPNRRSSHKSKNFGYRHSFKNRSSISSANNKRNMNSRSHISIKMTPEDLNYLQMSEIRQKKEEGLNHHHRLQSDYEGSYHTSRKNTSRCQPKQIPFFPPSSSRVKQQIQNKNINISRKNGSYGEYQADKYQSSGFMTPGQKNQNINSSKLNADFSGQKKSSFLCNNSNAENQSLLNNEQADERRIPRINFVYTNSVYNCSSNCNSLRDNTFSVNQWNPKNKIAKNKKKSEEHLGDARKKSPTVHSLNKKDQQEEQLNENEIDPEILADLKKLKAKEED